MNTKKKFMVALMMLLFVIDLAVYLMKFIGFPSFLFAFAGCALFISLNLIEAKKEREKLFKSLMAEADEAFKKNHPQTAKKIFQRLLKMKPSSYEVLLGLGQSYRLMREIREALDIFTKAAKLAPDNYEAHFMIGITYLHGGKIREAIEALETARARNPGHAEIYYFLGKVHERIQGSNAAIEFYTKHLELKPDSKYREEIEQRIEKLKIEPAGNKN